MTTKKILSIILALVMLFSVTSVAASAAETIIEPFKPVTVTASAENNPVLKFVPEETKAYIVKSFAPDDVDPYCIINSEYESFMLDDSAGLTNFAEKYEFEAGVEYYITIYTYLYDDTTFDVVLECVHEWDDDTCTECGIVCDHETEGTRFNICLCGKVSDAYNITLGETINTTMNTDEPFIVKFVPEEDVAAILYSTSCNEGTSIDVYAQIYNAKGENVAGNDDFGDSMDFIVWYEFVSGETYYFEINTFYDDSDVKFSFVNAVHSADDGSEHPLVYTDDEYGTCQTAGYTAGIYCPECDEYLAGHTDGGYGSCEDYDWDDICDYCGESMVEDETPDDETPDNETNGYVNAFMAFSVKIVEFFKNLFLNFFRLFYNW